MHASKFTKFKLIVRDARVFPGIWFNFIYPHNSSLFFATPQIYVAADKNKITILIYTTLCVIILSVKAPTWSTSYGIDKQWDLEFNIISSFFRKICDLLMLNVSNLFGMTFRNQRHAEFMDETSIFLELNGLSSSGIALGKVLRFARDEKTKTHQMHKMTSDHLRRAKKMACEAFQKVKIIPERNWKKCSWRSPPM